MAGGKTNYQILLEGGATEEELRQVLQGGGIPKSYTDRKAAEAAAAAAAQPTYQLPSQWFNGMSRMSADQGWTIDDSDAATWQQIANLANSGNTDAAITLANQLAQQGKYGGYYDENGNYWGFAQGYAGGANASMQAVIGGKLLTPKGLEYEKTDAWLTPDGKVLNLGQNGQLTNNGETWGTTDNNIVQHTGRWYEEHGYEPQDVTALTWTGRQEENGWDPAETMDYMSQSGAFTNPQLNTLEGNKKKLAELAKNPNADPSAIAELQQTIAKQEAGQGVTPYQAAVNQADAGGTPSGGTPSGGGYSSGGAGAYVPTQTQPMSWEQWSAQNGGSKADSLTAPAAYDPNSDPAWQAYQKQYGNAKAPGWTGGEYDYTQNAAYQQYQQDWANKQTPEWTGGAFDYTQNTAYQQYLKDWANKQTPVWTGGEFDYTKNPDYIKYMENWGDAKAPEYAGDPYQARRDELTDMYTQGYGGNQHDAKRDAALAQYGQQWGGSDYQTQRDKHLDNAANMKWNYDPNTDPVWQAYQKQYRREGQRATEDTLGRVSGMTGGMPSSYAVTAASQAGNYYASQLSDKLPQLYQDAYNRYLQEYQRQLGLSDAYGQADNTEYQRWLNGQQQNLNMANVYNQYGQQDYSRWADQQNRYLTAANAYNQYGQRDYDQYLDSLNQFNQEKEFAYGAAQDAIKNSRSDYNTLYQQFLDSLNQFNQEKEFAYGAAQDSIKNSRSDYDALYQQFLDSLDQFNKEKEFAYGAAQDSITNERSDYNTRYKQWLDSVNQFNTEKELAYGAARDNQKLGMDSAKDEYNRYIDALNQTNYEEEQAYKRYRDTISDQRYDREWAQKLLEYADSQGWKWREWNQYLIEYGDKLSQQEREWAYKVMRDQVSDQQDAQEMQLAMAQLSAKYGDYSGLNDMGIDTSSANPKEVAYASDGSTYKFSTQDALYFVQNAPNGTAGNPTTMKGSDGSIWKKDEYGNVTITTTNGKVFTYSNNTPAVSGSGSGKYTGSGSGSGGGETYSTSTVNAAYKAYLNGDRSDLTLRILQSAGLVEPGGIPGEGDPESEYAVMDRVLADMQAQGRPWNQLQVELDAELRDERITREEYEALRQKYVSRGLEDGVNNLDGVVHRNGSPMSAGFTGVWRTVRDLADRQKKEEALAAMRRAYEAGTIHEYEIDVMMDQLGW